MTQIHTTIAANCLEQGLASVELAQAPCTTLIVRLGQESVAGALATPVVELLLPYGDNDRNEETEMDVRTLYDVITKNFVEGDTSSDRPKKRLTLDKTRVGYGFSLPEASPSFTVMADPRAARELGLNEGKPLSENSLAAGRHLATLLRKIDSCVSWVELSLNADNLNARVMGTHADTEAQVQYESLLMRHDLAWSGPAHQPDRDQIITSPHGMRMIFSFNTLPKGAPLASPPPLLPGVLPGGQTF